jgi:hypothetical protein
MQTLRLFVVLPAVIFGLPLSDCEIRINHHREKYGIDPITEREGLHTCANRQSQYDKEMGSHKSYKRCGGLESQGSGGGSTCSGVIDMFFNERWRCTDSTAVFATPTSEITIGNINQCRAACMEDTTFNCLSYDYDPTTDSCRFFDEASITYVKLVDDKLWLGSPDETGTKPSKVDGWESFSMIETDGANEVLIDVRITSFKWFGSNATPVRFFVYRSAFVDDVYEVVGQARASMTNVGVENIINLDSAIKVKKGDVIGWTWEGLPAFGFDYSNGGEIRYKNEENSGGPTNVGDTWEFDKGPEGRDYHVTASFVPDGNYSTSGSPRNYCAAALCQGHCGPVMHGGTTNFAWGEFENHYTLNWRPSATLPAGNECPSGISNVKCWTDPESGILWAYGVGGEDCHSTCSLAGANPSDFMCDVDSPITGGFDEVSKIMSKFENPYNANDTGEFTCTQGSCWMGETWRQISIHENNSDCYVPTDSLTGGALNKYICDARFGNANCFNQRFNQVCPCVPGCSSAAGTSCVSRMGGILLFSLIPSHID